MSTDYIKQLFSNQSKINQISALLSGDNKIHLKGLLGSSLSFIIEALFEKADKTFLLLANEKEEAAYLLNDLEQLIGAKDVLFYPSSYRRPYQIEETDNANVLLRSEVLNRINSRKKPCVIVSYPEAIFEKVVTKKELDKNTLKIATGDKVSIDFINEVLFEYDFKRVDFITEPGEFSVRGGILDVFSFSNDNPYRIEFFGNEVDSIRTFDVSTQLSIETKTKITIIPNFENKLLEEKRESFLEYINPKTSIFIQNTDLLLNNLDKLFAKAEESFEKLSKDLKHATPNELFVNQETFIKQALHFSVVEISTKATFKIQNTFEFYIKPQPSFNKQFDLLMEDLKNNRQNNLKNYLFCANEQQAKRFHDIFESMDEEQHEHFVKDYETIVLPLYQGFIDEENQIACYTDHQIFERYHKFSIKNGYAKKQNITLKELNSLTVGDYVTHIDHGIGKFGGLQKIQVEGKTQEAIKLIYADNDIVYVSIHSLHKISKYNGKDGTPPKIYKLGSGAWKALKQKTKARVKHIAFNLIQLYAKRRLDKGYAFAPDSYLQHELESSFIYEDTPDQLKATQDVKADMENERPMDRLVCGDVGFGKTEVAIRAAFKAVDNSKQVAILVPTTILAYQHFRTFKSRLKDLPVNISYLNRFRTAKQKSEILKDLESGKLDIIIGTHQLVNKNVKFKDLGLLIIDEEQKFGVNVKDRLKTIATNVDTLTLTATPIPRTLQFSLMAARDLSVINTPPPNRYPIETQVIGFNEEIIRDAISYEIERGGQIYFINNRLENIKEIAGMIQRLVPNAKVGIGHGQMEGKQLEEIMLSFMEGEFDVLVATTIIESGLDVPNANTIFINNANNFGLSDLHQMRGRVGRSNKKAFCYFITPPYSVMTEEARKRIQALTQFSELGSGFNIAMKDLEIRGAGDLLGGEQSGFINEIGFETYQKIMQEAIEELKENEFKDLYPEESNIETKEYVKDLQIDTDFELLFPDEYINSVTERLSLYNELAIIKTEEKLQEYQKQLEDRFGKLPKSGLALLDSLRLKWKATHLGIEKLVLKQGKLVCYFVGDQQSDYYQSSRFHKVLQFVQQNANLCKMKEKETKNGLRLLLTFEHVKSIKKALELIEMI
ncbi:transcription-repair coupling factor [Flavobacterium columnare NBRC 100251 = ATCC 23463]|uniref:Transcription-repair-coupling factor n=1 Tax=Flavobacterium columnare (strain ATCC 49512 / CIP 103533 / TG 44/87) TaxID=1041826 RepID=G8X8M8_FLACA|nr:transcription-repair coupling factor [Flavobacterium columnare ATCC 49512]ANO49661.1 transcription-repair coupling factor [Flavobacterium columnare]PDS27018.1 transcription-repair coupling factor [Flavobacterium columnare NBRC 100251 = ATCC 23463]APT22404.1 transcription-repair coupling factor [Flavobacterium columnare]MBF6653846.1 transcription-repair coupling factor [Flavobacterium columnare]